jgi:hypothetical protein
MVLFGSSFWACKLHQKILVLTGTVSDILFIPWIFLFPAVVYDFTEDTIIWLYLLIGVMFFIFLLRYPSSKKTVYFIGIDDPDVLVAGIEKTLEKKGIEFQLDAKKRQFTIPLIAGTILIEKNTKMIASVACRVHPKAENEFFTALWKSSIRTVKRYDTPDGKTFLLFVIAFLLLASSFILTSYKVYHLGFMIWG